MLGYACPDPADPQTLAQYQSECVRTVGVRIPNMTSMEDTDDRTPLIGILIGQALAKTVSASEHAEEAWFYLPLLQLKCV